MASKSSLFSDLPIDFLLQPVNYLSTTTSDQRTQGFPTTSNWKLPPISALSNHNRQMQPPSTDNNINSNHSNTLPSASGSDLSGSLPPASSILSSDQRKINQGPILSLHSDHVDSVAAFARDQESANIKRQNITRIIIPKTEDFNPEFYYNRYNQQLRSAPVTEQETAGYNEDVSNVIRTSLELCSDLSKFAYSRINGAIDRKNMIIGNNGGSSNYNETTNAADEPYVRKAYELKANIEGFLSELSAAHGLQYPSSVHRNLSASAPTTANSLPAPSLLSPLTTTTSFPYSIYNQPASAPASFQHMHQSFINHTNHQFVAATSAYPSLYNNPLSAHPLVVMDEQLASNSDLCAIRSRRPLKQLQKTTVKRRARPAVQANQRCHSCNASDTPEWRRGPDGPRTLCNACGLYYAKLLKRAKTGGATAVKLNGNVHTSAAEILIAAAAAAAASISQSNSLDGQPETPIESSVAIETPVDDGRVTVSSLLNNGQNNN